MFVLRKILTKCFYLFNIVASSCYKIYMLLFKKVDISFFAYVNIRQIKNISIGRYSTIGPGCILEASGDSKIIIGEKVTIQENTYLLTYGGKGIFISDETNINKDCILYGHGGLRIGKKCLIAAKCVFIPDNHKFDDRNIPIKDQGHTAKGIELKDDSWIGTCCKVLDGVTIGKHSVVGAGSVVKDAVPDYTVAAGSPARVLREIK
jgi:acetyltransferase-like isoleucine patch superfamily enzyme